MVNFENSRTKANLMAAFAGESQAWMKYSFYADKARKDGFEQIAEIFEETAKNERQHAKIWFTLIHSGCIGMTQGNLRDAAGGEHFEWEEMYSEFEDTAREEGYNDIAALFKGIARIERDHEARFRRLIGNIENGRVFSRDGDAVWICRKCGHIHIGQSAPRACPICRHPQSFFQIQAENY